MVRIDQHRRLGQYAILRGSAREVEYKLDTRCVGRVEGNHYRWVDRRNVKEAGGLVGFY